MESRTFTSLHFRGQQATAADLVYRSGRRRFTVVNVTSLDRKFRILVKYDYCAAQYRLAAGF